MQSIHPHFFIFIHSNGLHFNFQKRKKDFDLYIRSSEEKKCVNKKCDNNIINK